MTTTTLDSFAPLVRFAAEHPQIVPDDYMFMGAEPWEVIYRYKHINTRRYLNLDCELPGQAYRYVAAAPPARRYQPVPAAEAIEWVLS